MHVWLSAFDCWHSVPIALLISTAACSGTADHPAGAGPYLSGAGSGASGENSVSLGGSAGRSGQGSAGAYSAGGSSASGGTAAGGLAATAGLGGASGLTESGGSSPNPFAGASGAHEGGGSSGANESGGSGGVSEAGSPATLCSTTLGWGPSSTLAISTAADDLLGSLTPDELSLAWTTSEGGALQIQYADRPSLADPFGLPKILSGAFARDRAALSPDGLQLVLVNADRRGFTQYTRTLRTEEFGNPGFGPLASYAPDLLPPGHFLADPVLAPDDKTFIYSEYGSGVVDTVHQSKRLFDGDPWSPGSVLVAAELQASGTDRRRPTGLSADGRTLFFWDDGSAQERAGFFALESAQFSRFVDLGQMRGAEPNETCTRLYFSGPGQSSLELMVASAQ
jgi:hypothetical protein